MNSVVSCFACCSAPEVDAQAPPNLNPATRRSGAADLATMRHGAQARSARRGVRPVFAAAPHATSERMAKLAGDGFRREGFRVCLARDLVCKNEEAAACVCVKTRGILEVPSLP